MKSILKRIAICICVMFVLFSALTTVQATGMVITVGTVNVLQGIGNETIHIPITLSGNTGIAGMVLQMSYTDGLIFTGITQGRSLGTLTLTKPGDFSVNPLNFVWDGKDADTTNGNLATLTFSVPKNIVKNYEICVKR